MQTICRFVRLKATLFLTFVRSLGTVTYILNDDCADNALINICNQLLNAWAVEVHTAEPIISVVADIGKPVILGVFLQIVLLVGNTVALSGKLIIP